MGIEVEELDTAKEIVPGDDKSRDVQNMLGELGSRLDLLKGEVQGAATKKDLESLVAALKRKFDLHKTNDDEEAANSKNLQNLVAELRPWLKFVNEQVPAIQRSLVALKARLDLLEKKVDKEETYTKNLEKLVAQLDARLQRGDKDSLEELERDKEPNYKKDHKRTSRGTNVHSGTPEPKAPGTLKQSNYCGKEISVRNGHRMAWLLGAEMEGRVGDSNRGGDTTGCISGKKERA